MEQPCNYSLWYGEVHSYDVQYIINYKEQPYSASMPEIRPAFPLSLLQTSPPWSKEYWTCLVESDKLALGMHPHTGSH